MFEIFKSYQFNKEKAHAYGFVEMGEVWTYSCQILQGDFSMTVSITPDNVSFQVFDQETGDLYPQVHMESMTGSFVASVREACLEILYQIRKACFDVQDFICPQTKRIMLKFRRNMVISWSICGKSLLIQLYCAMKTIKSGMLL